MPINRCLNAFINVAYSSLCHGVVLANAVLKMK